MKNTGRNTNKTTDTTTSHRLSIIAKQQLQELSDFLGENGSRVIVRALDLLHSKYQEEINNANAKRKEVKKK